MIIVQINDTYGTGSIGRSMAEMAIDLQKKGNTSYVFYASGTSSYENSKKIGNNIDQKIHAVLSRLTGMQGYFSWVSTYKLLKHLNYIKPDIVHLRNLHSNYINLRMLLQYLTRNDIATVVTLHDCWVFTGKCTYYVSVSCKKWKERCGKCPLLHEDNINPTFFFDKTTKCINDKRKWFREIPRLGVVGVSRWVTNEAKQSILSDRSPITIYNWIDQKIFYPHETSKVKERLSIPNNKFVVLMVTTFINKIKGYDVLLDLTKKLDARYQIVIVGKNAAKLEIPSRVTHVPYLNNSSELAEIYSMADVCINTTKYETFGKVTAEAVCCGTPVIVYNNTASPELVGQGCGHIVEERDGINGIIEAIETIRYNTKKYYTNNCLTFARKHFDKERAVEQYIRVYTNLIEKKH